MTPFARARPGLLPLIVCILGTGCYPSHYREARGRPPAALAKLRVQAGLTITAIDDRRLPIPGLMILPRRWDDFYIEPGIYRLRLLLSETGRERVVLRAPAGPLVVHLEPGMVRYVCPGVEFNRIGRVMAFEPYVAEFPNFNPDRHWWQIRHLRPKTPPHCQ